jgi:hypothetical protein
VVFPLDEPAKLTPVLGIVLLVSVSLPDSVANVPLVGIVTPVAAVVVMVRAYAPLKLNEAPVTPKFVILLALLSSPFFDTNLLLVAIFIPV